MQPCLFTFAVSEPNSPFLSAVCANLPCACIFFSVSDPNLPVPAVPPNLMLSPSSLSSLALEAGHPFPDSQLKLLLCVAPRLCLSLSSLHPLTRCVPLFLALCILLMFSGLNHTCTLNPGWALGGGPILHHHIALMFPCSNCHCTCNITHILQLQLHGTPGLHLCLSLCSCLFCHHVLCPLTRCVPLFLPLFISLMFSGSTAAICCWLHLLKSQLSCQGSPLSLSLSMLPSSLVPEAGNCPLLVLRLTLAAPFPLQLHFLPSCQAPLSHSCIVVVVFHCLNHMRHFSPMPVSGIISLLHSGECPCFIPVSSCC